VKGFAAQEKEVLLGVTNARAKVGSIQATPELINDPEAFAKFQSAQGELSSALSRLLVVAENYPQLKSDANFRELQAQLEGTENRITVARNRYIKAVQEYNVVVRSFPSNLTAMIFGFQVKPGLTVENEKAISTVPKVDFSKPLVVQAGLHSPCAGWVKQSVSHWPLILWIAACSLHLSYSWATTGVEPGMVHRHIYL
jgi:LemA protein